MASKASEWRRKVELANEAKPESLLNLDNGVDRAQVGAWVTGDADCKICCGSFSIVLSPSAALAVAAWILATFGDQEGA